MDIVNNIHNVDAREFTKNLIPSKSIDFIITDPVYNRYEDYEWLAQEAKRILKPDKSLIAFCSDIQMFECKSVMEKHLRFIKPLYYVVKAKQFSALRGYNIMTWTTPALWFTNGKGWPYNRTLDTIISTGLPDGNYKWNKNLEAYARWINDWTLPNELIFDPFCGSGTVPYLCKQLGRDFIACEIDSSVFNDAVNRISVIQKRIILPDNSKQKEMLL
jgi:site-specific DNA-methyltransferase (adenine-specific)